MNRSRRSRRSTLGFRKLHAEHLESRRLLTADLQITNAFLVDSQNNPISSVVEGEVAYVRAQWQTTGLSSSQQYHVHFEMDGVTVASGTITGQSGSGLSYFWWRSVTFAAPGLRTMTVTVDGNNVINEVDETNNTFSFDFTPQPTDIPGPMLFPMGGELQQDWSTVNYVDVHRESGQRQDFRGGNYQYDGHDAFDIALPNFERMDQGVPVYAALGGTVFFVEDGHFDRETGWSGSPANFVALDHGNGWASYYYHFQQDTITVQLGDVVEQGDVLGLVGSSGNSTDAHLHFSLYRNGSTVEPMYQPNDYFLDPPVYQGDLPPAVTASGITDRAPWNESKEKPNDIREFRTDSTDDTWLWYRLSHLNDGEQLAIEWYRPDGGLDATYGWTANGEAIYHIHGWVRNTRAHPGTWTVLVKNNGNVLATETFKVISSGGGPEIDLRQSGTYILDGRSTPIDFGGIPAGASTNRNFTVSNYGYSTLTISDIKVPEGFEAVTSTPVSVAAGNSTTITLRMTGSQVGMKRGDVVLETNDADELSFTFEVEGVVTGNPQSGAATLSQSLPALVIEDDLSHAVFPDAVLGNVLATALSQGEIVATIAAGKQSNDILEFAGASIVVSGGQLFLSGSLIGDIVADGSNGSLTVDLANGVTVAAVETAIRSIRFAEQSSTPKTNRRWVSVRVANSAGVRSNILSRGVFYSDQVITSIDAIDDSSTTSQNTSVAIGVLDNDIPNGQVMVVGTSTPANGSLVTNPDGTITYTPNLGFSGSDSFGYTIAIQDAELTPSTASVGDRFGYAVDVAGDFAVVGAYLDDPAGLTNAGSAIVFERTGESSWTQVAVLNGDLNPDDAQSYFGWSVAVDGDTVAIGAMLDRDNGYRSGAAYVFQKDAGGTDNWGRVAKVTGVDVDNSDYFGRSIDISGDSIVVGASIKDGAIGAAYVFERNQGGIDNWGQAAKLAPAQLGSGDRFGQDVAIDQNRIVVGAFRDNDQGTNAGTAYVFDRSGTNWNQTTQLYATDAVAQDFFGYSVAVDGDRIAIGSPQSDITGANQVGAVYVFDKDTGGSNNWGQSGKLTAEDATAGDRLGWSVGLAGSRVVSGAVQADIGGDRSGKAYVFEQDGGSWSQTRELVNEQVTTRDEYGVSVAVDGDMALIGSWLDNRPQNNTGGAYAFDLRTDTATVTVNVTASSPPARSFAATNGFADEGIVVDLGLPKLLNEVRNERLIEEGLADFNGTLQRDRIHQVVMDAPQLHDSINRRTNELAVSDLVKEFDDSPEAATTLEAMIEKLDI